VGDFNGDGKLDLVVANTDSNNVSILLGNGDGTFQAPVEYAVGSNPVGVVVADFNGDTKLDIIVADSCLLCGGNGPNFVSVLLGNGDGTFQAAVNYPVGSSGPYWVTAGDFNGDAKPDVAVANENTGNVSVLLGNGDGTFQAPLQYGTGPSPLGVTAADFNGDGRIDLAMADDGYSTVSVLLQIPTVSLGKTSLKFADQVIGTSSPSQTVTLTNGGLPLTIRSIAVTGTNATDFSQTNTCGSGLAPGGKCTIRVIFTPTQIGPRTASVTISDNAAGTPQSVALSGTGVVSGINATLSPTALTFATQLVGTTSAAQSVTLTDYGTVALSITNIGFTGADPADFQQSNTCGSSVAPGSACTINVSFKPTNINTRTASLSITDNAPGTPQSVSITGTGTVVKFVPASLNFGRVKVGQSSTQTTTLTNTAASTLSITGIMSTGSSAFSQTNNCGSSLGAGKACRITVTFKPGGTGLYNGALSVSDNGGASPQQVPLSGTGYKFSTAARSALAATPVAFAPRPVGPSPVGTRVMDLVDPKRDDPYLANGSKRELLVRFWYPASVDQDCEAAEYTSPQVWSYFSQLLGIQLPEVYTNSCLNTPIANGLHPMIIFTHGYTGTFTDYTFIFEDLASRGYIVASLDHTHEATAEEFPDGRFVESVFGSHFTGDTLRSDEQAFSFATYVRLGDLKFVVDELERLNARADSLLAGKLDMSRVALGGHSLGGLAAYLSLLEEPRFRAGILIDSSGENAPVGETRTPVLILAMGREEWSDNECRLWKHLHGPRLAVNLRGAEHVTPTDAVWLAKGAIKTGAMGPEKTIAAIRDYIAAFLDRNLRGKPSDRLLSGLSSKYPDAVVTTRDESFCSGSTGN
jgi:dienelactone hydrolase